MESRVRLMITPWKLPEWMAMLDPERYSDVFRGRPRRGVSWARVGPCVMLRPPHTRAGLSARFVREARPGD